MKKKLPGYIDIPVCVIKSSKYLIAGFLTRVFNKCLDCGNYSDILKVAKVVSVHKGGTRHCVSNYRPISILSSINKLFETLLHKRLTEFFDKYNLLYDNQFGFRKKHSTNLAITHFYETILEHPDYNLLASSVFLELAKAFDTVNHEILLSKLYRYEVRGIPSNYWSLTSQTDINMWKLAGAANLLLCPLLLGFLMAVF